MGQARRAPPGLVRRQAEEQIISKAEACFALERAALGGIMNGLQPALHRGWRKKIRAALNRVGRAAHVGNYWYWLEPPELEQGIDIVSIVCPLRYDVLVRRDFLSFYAAHRDLYVSDFAAFVGMARQSSYYQWFMRSEAVRCKRELLGNAAALEAAFVERIRRAAQLYESVTEHGFDPGYPIVLKTAERLLPPTADRLGPPTGKHVSARYFLADGCHRLALLMQMGYTTLPAGYFRVKCFRTFSPFDSTSLLVRTLSIDPARYFAFLSSYYCAPHVFTQRDEFLTHIRAHRPEFLDEVLSVISADGFDSVR